MTWLIRMAGRVVGAERAIPVLIMVVLFAVLVGVGLTMRGCTQHDKAAQATKGADAYAGAAKDAVATVVAAGGREKDVDAVVASATKEITDAKDPVAARAAVVSAVCGMRAYRDRPECAVR